MTKIEWTDVTWNIVTGCTRVSPGCEHCYAERLAATRMKNHHRYRGVARMTNAGPRFTGLVRTHSEMLEQPLRWRKPRMIFVSAQSDLFHDDVPAEFIAETFAVMAQARQHRFQVLTKRIERAAYLLSDPPSHTTWPLPNVWIETSVEDKQRADERIPVLLDVPAAVRFLSVEPLLGSVDLRLTRAAPLMAGDGPNARCFSSDRLGLHWVIVGGESGPGARPMRLEWARSIVEQCSDARVACFVKQLGANAIETDPLYGYINIRLRDSKGGDPSEWPEDLRVREFPKQGMWA